MGSGSRDDQRYGSLETSKARLGGAWQWVVVARKMLKPQNTRFQGGGSAWAAAVVGKILKRTRTPNGRFGVIIWREHN